MTNKKAQTWLTVHSDSTTALVWLVTVGTRLLAKSSDKCRRSTKSDHKKNTIVMTVSCAPITSTAYPQAINTWLNVLYTNYILTTPIYSNLLYTN